MPASSGLEFEETYNSNNGRSPCLCGSSDDNGKKKRMFEK
jgi:hypothetical protein